MISTIIKIILGLFVWLALPSMLTKNEKMKNKGMKKFISISCLIIGIAIIVYAVIGLIEMN